jgi:hypothetical protein
MEASMIMVHFVILVGQGDTMIHLINQQTLDWLNSDLPAFSEGIYSVEDVGVPQAIQDHREENGETGPFKVSSGSGYNDRMLACPLNMFEHRFHVDHFSSSVTNILAMTETIKLAGFEVGETVEGYIY